MQARIRSPKTKRLINVNGVAYQKLLKEGYTNEALLGIENTLVPTELIPIEVRVPEDVIREILISA